MRSCSVPVRLSIDHWCRITELARTTSVSGQVALNSVVERGLRGEAAHELSRLSDERAGGLDAELRQAHRAVNLGVRMGRRR